MSSVNNKGRYKLQKSTKRRILVLAMAFYDFVAIHAAYFFALWGRSDFVASRIRPDHLHAYLCSISVYALVCIIVFERMRLYHSLWQYAGHVELMKTFQFSVVASVAYSFAITVFQRMPLSYYIWGAIFQFFMLFAGRFSYRFLLISKTAIRKRKFKKERVMLIGAGAAGRIIMRDLIHAKETNQKVVCIIDDDPDKWFRQMDGVPIVGGRDTIVANAKKYNVEKIFIAIPSATAEQKRDILHICNETDCEVKQLPGIYQFVLGEVSLNQLKDVSVEDLLGRDPIHNDLKETSAFLKGKTVLVTGGGGSIGSELCRQIAPNLPKTLIIFDVYENNAYDIQLELREKHPELDLKVIIGSVRDSRKLLDVFGKYRPEIVYHAAAHKHVPLMEDSPCEAIKNNAVGTYKTAYAAMLNGCKRFVLISTDKAVNPTNIMGASKRLCEMIIQAFDKKIKDGKADEIPQLFTHEGDEDCVVIDPATIKDIRTEFVAVRFGNVLGSNGSVIPVFKKQIEKGGPITVTHPDIIRYFMTIPEAVSLVLLAGIYAKGGEIFVLDMGSPVKIDTLARNMIKLSGLRPDIDIKIVYSGLRPGEKLYEEKLMAEEGLKQTDNKLIHIGCPIPFDVDVFLEDLKDLMDAAYSNRRDIRTLVEKIVTTYHPIDN